MTARSHAQEEQKLARKTLSSLGAGYRGMNEAAHGSGVKIQSALPANSQPSVSFRALIAAFPELDLVYLVCWHALSMSKQ